VFLSTGFSWPERRARWQWAAR